MSEKILRIYSKEVDENQFLNNQLIEEIVFETSTKINKNAFRNCKNLKKVSVAPGVTLSVSKLAFCDCSSLESFPFSNCSMIGERAFFNTSIKEIKTSSWLKYIGSYAFGNCYRLIKADFSSTDNFTLACKYIFSNCIQLHDIYLPLYQTDISPDIIAKTIEQSTIEVHSLFGEDMTLEPLPF